MDMAVVITQCLLLPMLPHLRPAKCLHSAGRRPTTSEECQVRHQAGLVCPEIQTLPKKNVLIRLLSNLRGWWLKALLCAILDRRVVAQYFYLGKINEHLFFDTSNSISRLVSGGLLPSNPALVLLWLLIPISGLSHGVIATVIHVFINFTFHHLFIGLARLPPRHRCLGQEVRRSCGRLREDAGACRQPHSFLFYRALQ